MSTYGSLAVWSTQGMEKSHYTAKTVYHKHTQHSGTVARRSAIIQTYEWWFRVIQHREYEIIKRAEQLQNAPFVDHQLRARRLQSFLNSSAQAKHVAWRESRLRHGRIWVQPETIVLETQADENVVQ